MIEQEKGLLYLVKLNNTSFEQNPGKFNLPRGKYVAEIREGVFSYKAGHAADVEVLYENDGGKKKLRLPEFGRFKEKETAENVYQGISVEFEHDGGNVEIYNPRPAKQFFGKTMGNCVVGVWDGIMFGSPSGCFEPEEYNPTGKDNILILTSNPGSKPYEQIKGNLAWQSDLRDFGKYNLVIIPPESFSFLYKIRDNECLDPYIKSGGRVYLAGAAPQYLNYNNNIPFDTQWYLGGSKFNMIATSAGDAIIGNGVYYAKFSTTLTVPMILSDGLAHLYSSDASVGSKWCAAKKIQHEKGKVAWTSFFIMDYENTENWNKLVLDQIEWLME